MLGQLADPLDDEVRRQQPVAPRSRTVPARALGIAPPLGQLVEVLAPRLRLHGGDHRQQRREDPLRVADDRHLDRHVLADLGGVDVDVDDPGIRGVRPDVAGDTVVEAHPDGDQQVGRLDRAIDVLPAVHAHEAVAQRMCLVDGADAQEGVGDRDLGLLGQLTELVPGLGVEDSVTGEDHRTLRASDLGGGELELPRVAVHVRAEAGQAGDDLVVARMDGGRLLLEGVLGDVDVDRPRPAGSGDVERLGEDARQVVGIANEVVVLGHRQRDAVDIDLLEGVLAEERRGDVAGDRDDRHRVQLGRRDPGHEVRRAGS